MLLARDPIAERIDPDKNSDLRNSEVLPLIRLTLVANSVLPTSQAFLAISAKLTPDPPTVSNFSTIDWQTVSSSTTSAFVALGRERRILAHAQCLRTADGGNERKDEMRRASRWRFRAVSLLISWAGESWVYLSYMSGPSLRNGYEYTN